MLCVSCQFWGQSDEGFTVVGEVSSVCNDDGDNVFVEGATAARFPTIEEDLADDTVSSDATAPTKRRHMLVCEYP